MFFFPTFLQRGPNFLTSCMLPSGTKPIFKRGPLVEKMSCSKKRCFSLKELTFKVPITTAADDIHKYFFHCFSEKIRHDVSSESSARQRIHMKNQVLFSLKDKSKQLKCRLLQFLIGALKVNST